VSFITVDELETREPMEGFKGRFVHSDNVTVASWQIKEGSEAPKHSHPHEQIAFVVEGRFRLTVGDETRIIQPGITAVIPSNVIHSGIALTDCSLVDVFHPVREDYR
jgi:quercetin dioxygenase-like cupin family protein